MNDALLVRRIEPSGNLSRETKRLVHGNQTPRDAFLKRLAFDELHHETLLIIMFLEPVERGDAGVIQLGEKSCLALETLHPLFVLRELFGKDFDRDFAPELRVASAVDLTHPALPDGRDDLVSTELRSRR